MTTIAFVVPGTPVGKGRPRFAKRGAFVQTFTPEKTANYENLVKVNAVGAMNGRQPIQEAVGCAITIEVIPPASWSQKKRSEAISGNIRPTTKPDLDNVAKCIFDAMNEIVFLDDKQVVEMTVKKRYAEMARALVEVKAL